MISTALRRTGLDVQKTPDQAGVATQGSKETTLTRGWATRCIPPLNALPLLILFAVPVQTMAAEDRCGWLENPTPSNYSLRDRAGDWIIAEQRGFQAEGLDRMPDMTTAGWVETNGHYGYGCGCLRVETDTGRRRVTRVLSAKPVPLTQCRADRRLPRP